MEDFISYILQFGNLNQQQIDLISKKAILLVLKKDDFYLEAGQISKRFGFVTDGILRVSYFNNKSEEITKYFIDENNIVVDLESFDNEIPSIAYVQAMTDCKIIVFAKRLAGTVGYHYKLGCDCSKNCFKSLASKSRTDQFHRSARCNHELFNVP